MKRSILIIENHLYQAGNGVNNGLTHASRKSHNALVNHLPIEKLVDLNDEKEIIDGMGGKNRYIANTSNTYKLLGSVGGASAGVKAGLESGELYADPDEPTLALDLAAGAAGFLGGGYLGSKFGKDYGNALSTKTYNTIYDKK